MSKLEVDKIDPQSGTDLELGSSGDTITIPTGATLDASNATTTLPANVVTTDGTQTLTNKSIAATQLTGTITPSDNTVSLAKLTATGTKDATTFLRGDNTFAEAGGGGKILQVVEGTSSTQHEANGTSDQDIGLSVNITPSSTSSKILVTVSFLYKIFLSGSYGSTGQFALLRDSTAIITRSGGSDQDYNVEASALSSNNYVTMAGINTMQILDAPSTTSQITYKVQSSGISSTRVFSMHNNRRGSIVAMEVSS